jgi:serine/threonine protein kinase
VKIGDFGISKRSEEGMTALRTISGTPGFLAPELLVQSGLIDVEGLDELREYTVAVDILSLGEIIFRALTSQPPFPRSLAAYVKGNVGFPYEVLHSQKVSNPGCDFIRGLMRVNPKERTTARDALGQIWIASQKTSSPKTSGEIERPDYLTQHVSFGMVEGDVISDASAVWSSFGGSTQDLHDPRAEHGINDTGTKKGSQVLNNNNLPPLTAVPRPVNVQVQPNKVKLSKSTESTSAATRSPNFTHQYDEIAALQTGLEGDAVTANSVDAYVPDHPRQSSHEHMEKFVEKIEGWMSNIPPSSR